VTILDWTLIVIVGFFCIRGLFRGFLLELFDLIALLGGYLAARFGGPALGKILADSTPISRWLGGILAAIILFVGIAIALRFFARMLKKVAKAASLGGVDRGIGALFGFFKATLIILIIFFMISLSPLSKSMSNLSLNGTVSSWYWLGSQLFREAVKVEPIAPTQAMAKWLRGIGINDEAVHIITDRPDLMLAILDHARTNDIKIPVDDILNGEVALNAKELKSFSSDQQQNIVKTLESQNIDIKEISRQFWSIVKDHMPNE